MVTLKQIQYFLALAAELHFARAAQKLGITQATLSCEIKKMEQKLGFLLFDRSDKWEIRMTEAGKSYRHLIEKVPESVQNAARESAKVARGESGNLTLAVASYIYGVLNIAAVCKKMHSLYPDVTIQILDHFSAEIVEDYVRQRKADLGFSVTHEFRAPLDGITGKILFDIPVQLAISAKSPLAEKEKITMDDIKDSNFIMPPRYTQPHLRQTFDNFFTAHFHKLPQVVQEVEGFHGMQQFVAEGYGIGLFPGGVKNEFPDRLVFRDMPILSGIFLMLVMQEEYNSTLVNNFIKILFEEVSTFKR
ncbi:MAG: LysR family transcriptional regulator [Lentisphaeria bacterium]|nr:LysR family transcriptional regulator [Lentisphaeria bacterium]MBQ9087158.1 LysR family transcriptional regulator [Lentisphaeria bacterium]